LPVEDPDRGGDVCAAAVGLCCEVARLADGRTRRRRRRVRRWWRNLGDHKLVDVLVNVDRGRRAAHSLRGRRDLGHSHWSGCAYLWVAQRIPTACARESTGGHGHYRCVTGLEDTGSVIAVLVEVKTLTVNDWFVPVSMDRFGVGVMAMLAGTAKFVVLTALLLPHPTRPATRRIGRATANPTKPDLPMHPPRPHARPRASTLSSSVFALEVSQCRGCEFFRQVEPACGRPSPQRNPERSEGFLRAVRSPCRNPERSPVSRFWTLRRPFTTMLAVRACRHPWDAANDG